MSVQQVRAPTREEFADYASAMLAGLSAMAEGAEMARLAALLRAAAQEAEAARTPSSANRPARLSS